METRRCLSPCFLLTFCIAFGFQNGNNVMAFGTSVHESLQSFSTELYRSIERSGDNAVVSPLTLFTSLALTSMGARGTTLAELHRTLRFSSSDTVSRKRGMAKLLASIMSANSYEDVQLEMANFLWVPRGVAIKGEYARAVEEVFHTRIRDADFTRAEEVRFAVNQRISNVTRGHVRELLPKGSVSPQTRLLLANALYFKGLWLHPFSQTNTIVEPFFTDEGISLFVPMMHISESFKGGVFEDLRAKAVVIPYKDSRYGLLCVLPDRNLLDLTHRLFSSGYSTTGLLKRMIHRDVNLTLPRFKTQFNMEMTPVLKQMGIRDLFNSNADLSGMSSSAWSSRLKVSNVFTQATIEVNEGGSEAAAAAGFEITPLMGGVGKNFGPMEFRADHPFLFYLIDRENDNIPLFMGHVRNPLETQAHHDNGYTNNIPDSIPEHPISSGDDYNRVISSLTDEEKIRPRPSHHSNRLPSTCIQKLNQVTHQAEQPPPYRPYYYPYHPERVSFISFPSKPLHSADPYLREPMDRIRLYYDRIMFPDHEDIGRFKRVANKLEAAMSAPESGKEEDVETRLKDPFWFSKPTVTEVIIPINNSPPTNGFGQPASPQNGELNPLGGNRPELTATTPSPAQTATAMKHSRPPFADSFSPTTTPPNIFEALTQPPKRMPTVSAGWSGGGVTSLPISTTPPPPPLALSSNWHHQGHTAGPHFHPGSLTNSGSPIFFPDFRTMDKTSNGRK